MNGRFLRDEALTLMIVSRKPMKLLIVGGNPQINATIISFNEMYIGVLFPERKGRYIFPRRAIECIEEMCSDEEDSKQ